MRFSSIRASEALRIDAIAIRCTHRIKHVAQRAIAWGLRIGHEEHEPLFRCDVGREAETRWRLAGKPLPPVLGSVEGPHVGEVLPIVAAANDDPARLRIVHCKVAGTWRRSAWSAGLPPLPRLQIEKPGVR